MKIYLRSGKHNFRLYLPTGLIFSKTVARLGCKYGLRYAGDAMKDISPEALGALFAEFRRIKQKHGNWELADVESANGEIVKIIL